MKCNCSLSNEYEIVGLCDIAKFNKKINEFQDKSWTQISISDNLNFSSNKLSIRNITKTFVTVKITSTKLINTPKSNNPNIEGMSLTGKLLLVVGEIVQRVLYVPNNSNLDKITSFKIKTPFTTYIVVDSKTDISVDKYCVYSCIEYSSLRLINNKSLSQNVTLFLFAHLIEECGQIKLPGPELVDLYYPSEIIFKSNKDNEELAKVKFNISKSILEATYTKHFEPGDEESIIQFELFESNGKTKKEDGKIAGGQNANNFAIDLNNKGFQYGDIIKISYSNHPKRVNITNHPKTDENYEPKFRNHEAFILSKDGLVPYLLLNEIILTNTNNETIVKLSFSKIDNRLRVISTEKTAPSSFTREQDYFKIVLITSNYLQKQEIYTGIVKGSSNSRIFKGSLDLQEYKIGDIIEVFCEEIERVTITNYPDKNNNYNLEKKNEKFRITENGLEKIDILPEINTQIILFDDSINQRELAILTFDTNTNALKVENKGNRNNDKAIKLDLYDKSRDKLEAEGEIEENSDANKFAEALDGKLFEEDYVISIFYGDKADKILIKNDEILGNEYIPKLDNNEAFLITKDGLNPYRLTESIRVVKIRGDLGSGKRIVEIYFSTFKNELRVVSTGEIAPGSLDDKSYYFKLIVSRDNKDILEGTLLQGDNGNSFKNDLDSKIFSIGDTLTLLSEMPLSTRIANSIRGTNIKFMENEIEKFKITQDGLVKEE